jgi:predicted SAM-dependent methyltransferase
LIEIYTISKSEPLRIILGAGEQHWTGWISTQKEILDLLNPSKWDLLFHHRLADTFLCVHVWEHLTEEQGRAAARLCFNI